MFNNLISKYGLKPSDFDEAFTHISYAHLNGLNSNERLEFLGDSIINFFTTIELYKKFADKDEGELSKLRARMVSSESLAKVFKTFNLKQYLKIVGVISKKTAANTVEAVVACAFLKFVNKNEKDLISDFINDFVLKYCLTNTVDYKSTLQEIIQKQHIGELTYDTNKEDNKFYSKVIANNKVLGEGYGSNKKMAEQNAAKKALNNFNN